MASFPEHLDSIPPGQPCRIERKPGFVEAAFDSDANHLAPIRTAIESFCTEAGFDAKAAGEIGLVVNEAVANVIRHAYGSKPGQPILARAEMKNDEIQISIRDWGNGQQPKPRSPDPLTPGGLGLVCMKHLMDHVLFTPQPRGMLLTMRRKRNRGPGCGSGGGSGVRSE